MLFTVTGSIPAIGRAGQGYYRALRSGHWNDPGTGVREPAVRPPRARTLMPSAVTLSRVKRVVRTCLKVEDATPFDDAMPLVGGEFDLDSLDILLIVTELEKEFGVKMNEGAMGKGTFATIQTLAAFIEGLPRVGGVKGL